MISFERSHLDQKRVGDGLSQRQTDLRVHVASESLGNTVSPLERHPDMLSFAIGRHVERSLRTVSRKHETQTVVETAPHVDLCTTANAEPAFDEAEKTLVRGYGNN